MKRNNIKRARQEKGMTLKCLSAMADVSIGYICHLEKGTRTNPSMHIMERLAKSLNKSVSELFFMNEK